MVRLLADPLHGVALTNPVMALAFLGLSWVARIQHRPQIFLILLVGLIQFLFYATYDEWDTSHFSNRFLMTFIALSSVLASNALSVLYDRFSSVVPPEPS